MRTVVHRLIGRRGATEFCDSCAQVCTPQCRAAAQQGRNRDRTAHLPIVH